MANFQIPQLDPLELTDGTAATNWRAALFNYTLAMKLDKEDKEHQVATLLVERGCHRESWSTYWLGVKHANSVQTSHWEHHRNQDTHVWTQET